MTPDEIAFILGIDVIPCGYRDENSKYRFSNTADMNTFWDFCDEHGYGAKVVTCENWRNREFTATWYRPTPPQSADERSA